MESDSAREQFSRLRSQVSYLYKSGTAVMGRIDEAIKSSVFQAMEVQIASHNASQIYQRAQVTRTGARSSVSRTYHLNRNAQRMLQVVRNFETESLRAQASAATTLSLIPSLRNITHRIMREVSIVNESSASVLSTASEAWQLGRSVYNLSLSEKKVRFTLVFFFVFSLIMQFTTVYLIYIQLRVPALHKVHLTCVCFFDGGLHAKPASFSWRE